MKNLFKIDDDWNDNPAVVNFISKSDSIGKKIKNKVKILKHKINSEGSGGIGESFMNSKAKKVKKKMDKIDGQKEVFGQGNILLVNSGKRSEQNTNVCKDNFDGKCRFTPLLRKNANCSTNESTTIVHPAKSRKRSKKLGNNLNENSTVKKRKLESEPNKYNGDLKKKDFADKNLKNIDFANKLRENLLGGRFRFLNEQLYTVTGDKAKQMFEQDVEAYKAYHQGYRQQIEKWPFNPLDRIIKRVRRLPKHMTVADFGCGDAKLAESIPHKCFSIDLVSSKPNIIACDMANTPLKSESIDIAIFCLSLMGTNLKDFICEANRILKADGLVYIVEIGSRFENVKDFKKLWEHFGFELLRQDVDKKNYFYFFDFKKVENCKKNLLSVVNCVLRPCLYKKR